MANLKKITQEGLHYFLMAVIGAITIYLFFYQQINSGFTRIFGDDYDGVIEAVLVSHWYRVFQFHHVWNQPLYFYPYPDTLGYNDGYFIYGLIAAAYRVLGWNVLVSQELMHISVKAIGFFSMAALLSRLQQKNVIAILGAALFTLCINSSESAGHGQLLGVAFAPLLAFLLLGTVRNILASEKKSIVLYGAGFSLLYGATLLTGFYMAWFFGLFLIIYAIFYACLDFSKIKLFLRAVSSSRYQVAFILFVFLVAVIPFVFVYLPKLKETGGQGYGNQLYFSLHVAEMFNTGRGSLLWGPAFDFIDKRFPGLWRPGEYQFGFTPDILALSLFIISGLILRKSTFKPLWFKALGYATLIALVLPLSFSGHSLWFLVHSLIPGASGVRVISRFYIYLAFPVALLITVYFCNVWQSLPKARIPVFILLLIICASQVNLHTGVNLETKKIMARLDDATPVPKICASFFVDNPLPKPTDIVSRLYEQNVQAMLLADTFGIPTLNGFATFNPPDWVFEQKPMYLYRVGEYVRSHNLQAVCRYDIGENKWLTPDQIDFYSNVLHYEAGKTLSFTQNGGEEGFLLDGWSVVEDWGRWTDARTASLVMRMPAVGDGAVNLEFKSRAFLAATHQSLELAVSVNGQKLAVFNYVAPQDANDSTRTMKIPHDLLAKSGGLLTIRFDIEKPVSPASLGLSADSRHLGLGLVSLKLAAEPNR